MVALFAFFPTWIFTSSLFSCSSSLLFYKYQFLWKAFSRYSALHNASIILRKNCQLFCIRILLYTFDHSANTCFASCAISWECCLQALLFLKVITYLYFACIRQFKSRATNPELRSSWKKDKTEEHKEMNEFELKALDSKWIKDVMPLFFLVSTGIKI